MAAPAVDTSTAGTIASLDAITAASNAITVAQAKDQLSEKVPKGMVAVTQG